jgi:hypothetical protein
MRRHAALGVMIDSGLACAWGLLADRRARRRVTATSHVGGYPELII